MIHKITRKFKKSNDCSPNNGKRTRDLVERPAGTIYDEAIRCLCFSCDKCLKIVENHEEKTAKLEVEDIDFVTAYQPD